MPEVLNLRDLPGGRIPEGAVYIGRGRRGEFNKWGNPFVMHSERDRGLVLRNYEDWFETQEQLKIDAKEELRGKDLVCFCHPKGCHGHILRDFSNS